MKYRVFFGIVFFFVILVLTANAQSSQNTGGSIIQTPLPIVYLKKGSNTFEVLPGIDLNRKDEIWGYQLKCGIFLVKSLPINTKNCYHSAKSFAESMTFKGKKGELPTKLFLDENWSLAEKKAIEDTASILKRNKISSDSSAGIFWCAEGCEPGKAFRFSLTNGRTLCTARTWSAGGNLFAVFFP